MPPVIVAVVVAAAAYGVGVITLTAAIGLVVSSVLSYAAQSMQKKPKASSGASVDFSRDRTVTIRQPTAPWRVTYGEARVGGTYTYVKSTSNNQNLNLVITLSGHELNGLREVYFDDQAVPLTASAGRFTTSGRYASNATVWFGTGDDTNAYDVALQTDLQSNSGGEWTSNHKQSGRAKLALKLVWSTDIYPTGIPNISAVVQGKKVYDPRTATTAWHHNPALCLSDYLTSTAYGLGATYATEIDEDSLIAAANICDEMVAVVESSDVFTADASTDVITRTTFNARCNTGDKVQCTTTGALPGNLATVTDYFYIRTGKLSGKLASTYADAIAGTAINLTDAGTGTHTLVRKAEPRYTANGTFETDEKPLDIIQRLLSAMSGKVVFSGGKWKIYAGAYITPTETLTEGDARKGISVNTRVSRKENFNAVKGVYVSPYDAWQPTDFPAITNATYLSEDNSERVWKDIDLTSFTISASMSQRLAKIDLEKARQQITVTYPAKLSAYRLEPPDTLMLDNTRRGWDGKVFELTKADLVAEDDDGAPILGLDLSLRETASTVYDWNNGEETTVDPAPDSNLPDPFTVQPSGAPLVTEELYVTRDGAGVKSKAIITWEASTDGFLRDYQLEYKLSADAEYTVFPRVSDNYWELLDLTPGTYDFRVKAVNELGVSSAYSTSLNRQIFGLSAAPENVSGLTISTIGGLAILRWTQSTSIDVKIGGTVVFKHSPVATGAMWNESVSIGDAIPGSDTVAILPLKAGSYLAKFFDSSGVQSTTAATVTTKQATALEYANVTSITEDPTFAGSHSGTVLESTYLTLSGAGNFDDIPDLDAEPSLDAYGGIESSGTYTFSAGFDVTTVRHVRLTSAITAQTVNIEDQIDLRTAEIDTWDNFDGATGASADAQVWTRHTDDDPAGTPTWTDWQRLDSAEFFARGFQFQSRLFSYDPAYNIRLTGLSVTADEVL